MKHHKKENSVHKKIETILGIKDKDIGKKLSSSMNVHPSGNTSLEKALGGTSKSKHKRGKLI
jgi:hypothetical protein